MEHGLILLLLLAVYCSGIDAVRFHQDESAWIGSSFLFEEYFKGRFYSPVWDEDFTGSDRQYRLRVPISSNSTITRYLIGLGRLIGGIPSAELNLVWNFDITPEQNSAEGRMPSAALLWWSRLPMAVIAAGAIFLAYLLLRQSFGRLAAHVWVVLAALNPFFLYTFRRAMDEAALIFGICLVLYCSTNYLRAARGSDSNAIEVTPLWKRRDLLWLLLLGLSVGFTAGAKLNGVTALLVGLVTAALSVESEPRPGVERLRSGGLRTAIVTLSAYLAFLLPNPFLMRHPVEGIVRMYRWRADLMAIQFTWVPEHMRIDGMTERLQLIARRVFSDFAAFPGVPKLNLLLAAVGLGICMWSAWRWLRGVSRASGPLAILLTGAFLSLPVLVVHIDIDRYYMVPTFFGVLLVAAAFGIAEQRAGHATAEAGRTTSG